MPLCLSMILTHEKSDSEQTDLLHLEKYLRSSTKFRLKTCLQMIILPQTKRYIQQEVVYHSRNTLTVVKRIAEDYEEHGDSLKGTNTSMDRYYTSIPLAEWLYVRNITCIRTLNSNRSRF